VSIVGRTESGGVSDVAADHQGLDDFLDFCNNTMPARIAGVEEHNADAGKFSRIELHLQGLLERDPNTEQWDAAHVIARRFGLHPGQTRWQAGTTNERGRHAGTMVFERWHACSN
jgi:hypothetical protein